MVSYSETVALGERPASFSRLSERGVSRLRSWTPCRSEQEHPFHRARIPVSKRIQRLLSGRVLEDVDRWAQVKARTMAAPSHSRAWNLKDVLARRFRSRGVAGAAVLKWYQREPLRNGAAPKEVHNEISCSPAPVGLRRRRL
jgi:hypothetical protein